jgi:undecaprenyl-diphosphatase
VVAVVVYNLPEVRRLFLSFITLGRIFPHDHGVSIAAFIATLPVIIAGFFLNDNPILLDMLRDVEIIAWATLGFGILLGLADRHRGHRRFTTIHLGDAVVIGLAQCLALIPGTSRAGITMTAARAIGIAPRASARFSMILSIPVILGSGALKGMDMVRDGLLANQAGDMAIAGIITMLVALISIHIMITIIQRFGFMPFVIYRVLLGGGLLSLIYFY